VTLLDSRARTGVVARINPVAKLLASALIALPLILTLDTVSAAVALALEGVLFLFAGLTWREFWLRTWPVWIAAPLTALTILLYGEVSGEIYLDWFVVRVSDGSIALAAATFLRVLAVALPSVVLFVTVDPTDLADGLAQVLHLPARFVLGALAGCGWSGSSSTTGALELARRARGVADRGRVAGSSAWRSRCWCCRSGAGRSSPRRWKRAGSAPRCGARGRAPRPSARANGCSSRRGGDLGDLRRGRRLGGHVELHPRSAVIQRRRSRGAARDAPRRGILELSSPAAAGRGSLRRRAP
jgi:hypothetical protein